MPTPKQGDWVWLEGRINGQGGPNSNGVIRRIIYDDGPDEVVLVFDNGSDIIDYSELQIFNERLNQWLVYK